MLIGLCFCGSQKVVSRPSGTILILAGSTPGNRAKPVSKSQQVCCLPCTKLVCAVVTTCCSARPPVATQAYKQTKESDEQSTGSFHDACSTGMEPFMQDTSLPAAANESLLNWVGTQTSSIACKHARVRSCVTAGSVCGTDAVNPTEQAGARAGYLRQYSTLACADVAHFELLSCQEQGCMVTLHSERLNAHNLKAINPTLTLSARSFAPLAASQL